MSKAAPPIGQFIRDMRSKREWTREDMAAEAKERGVKLSASTIQKLEDGLVLNPSLDTVTGIATILEVSIDSLVGMTHASSEPVRDRIRATNPSGGEPVATILHEFAARLDESTPQQQAVMWNMFDRALTRLRPYIQDSAERHEEAMRTVVDALDEFKSSGDDPFGET